METIKKIFVKSAVMKSDKRDYVQAAIGTLVFVAMALIYFA